jgi:cytochrome c553
VARCEKKDQIMRLLGIAAGFVVLVSLAGPLAAQDSRADSAKAQQTAVNLCSTCHGPRGISTSPEFPILAAQREGYLVTQIEAFRSHARAEKDAHDFMWGIAGQLDSAAVAGLAQYYASQPPAPGRSGDPALIARGKELFDKGAGERGITACVGCHGANAEGMADFPRLAGQHAKYVAKQITYIQNLVRAAPVMHGIVKDLTPAEIQAVAAYVQSL